MQPRDAEAHHAVKMGEGSGDDDLADVGSVRVNRHCINAAVVAFHPKSWIKAVVEASVVVDAGDATARHPRHRRKRSTHQHLAVRLQRDDEHRLVNHPSNDESPDQNCLVAPNQRQQRRKRPNRPTGLGV